MVNNEMVFSVSNMKCAGCVSAVEEAAKFAFYRALVKKTIVAAMVGVPPLLL